MDLDKLKQAEDYLDLFEVEKGKYVIGVFQKGITFYKQQVRALNIFQALITAGKLVPPKASDTIKQVICVVGGGVAGLTFAATAMRSGFDVSILEEKPMLLHMQHGCQTRKIHPNIYDWPDSSEDSLSPYAKIPVLTWQYDTASNVADQIRNGIEEIIEEHKLEKPFLNSSLYRIKSLGKSDDHKFHVLFHFKDPYNPHVAPDTKLPGHVFADLIIYAPGYGIEKGVDSTEKTPSYWRNDDYAQPLVTVKQKIFCVHGVGDGGLIDVFRLKIRDFDLDSLFEILLKEPEQYHQLRTIFLNIKQDWADNMDKDEKGWLATRFSQIVPSHYEFIIKDYITPRLVSNKEVYLVGNANYFEDNLSLLNISLLNSFIGYLLIHEMQAVKYFSVGEWNRRRSKPKFEKTILRTGTNKKKSLENLKIPGPVITRLANAQKRELYQSPIQQWQYSEIVNLFRGNKTKKIEYYRTETVAVCSNFISILSRTLDVFAKKDSRNSKVRLALHRVVKIDGEICYQQITSYFDNGPANPRQRSVGSTYKLSRGNVGYSISTGKSLLIKAKRGSNVQGVIKSLNLSYDFEIGHRQSFLSIPVLGATEDQNLSTNLVLYMDSDSLTFFDNKQVITLIYNSLIGFIENIKRLLKYRQIFMTGLNFEPVPINKKSLRTIRSPMIIDMGKRHDFLLPNKTKLIFDRFCSFDIVNNYPSGFSLGSKSEITK